MARRRNPFSTLHRLAKPRPAAEVCHFCSVALPAGHRHLLETAARQIVCACTACALRFENVVGRFKLIPRDSRRLVNFQLTDAQWESLSLPIQLAFFFHSTPTGKVVALYPSPGGATESTLPLANWEPIVRENPLLSELQPDVEALLANRLGDAREYYIAGIDTCFSLAGLIRLHWRGFSGGDKVWDEIHGFFSSLRESSAAIGEQQAEASHA